MRCERISEEDKGKGTRKRGERIRVGKRKRASRRARTENRMRRKGAREREK